MEEKKKTSLDWMMERFERLNKEDAIKVDEIPHKYKKLAKTLQKLIDKDRLHIMDEEICLPIRPEWILGYNHQGDPGLILVSPR